MSTQFKNRRINVSVGRTIKFGHDFEFYRCDIGMEADIPDGMERADAHNQIFKELMEDLMYKEAVIKASGKDLSSMDMLVDLLKNILNENKHKENKNTHNENFNIDVPSHIR